MTASAKRMARRPSATAGALAQARGIDQPDTPAAPLPVDGDGIAGDAGLRPGQDTIGAQKGIDQRRLAGIGLADDGKLERPVLVCRFLVLVLARILAFHERNERIIEPIHTLAMFGRDGDRIAEAQGIGLEHSRLAGTAFRFVGEHQHWLAMAPELAGEFAIDRRHAGPRVDDEETDVGVGNRCFRLRAHAVLETAARCGIEACGVEKPESQIGEPALTFAAVARDARLVVDQRQLAAHQAVEERRFADIRPAEYRDFGGHQGWFSAERSARHHPKAGRPCHWR
jgi:hypothetical protein